MDHKSTKNRQLIFRYFLTIFLIASAVVIGVVAGFYYNERWDYLGRLKVEERASVMLAMALISNNLSEIVSDIRFLSQQNELIHMLDQEDSKTIYKDLLVNEYLEFSRQKKKYDQIRFLDSEGMEKVRVNFNSGVPVIVSDKALQSKRMRYYFKDTMALAQNEIFISPFDLNIEHGKIEEPFKPMIRFGLPVFDSKNQKRGAVILNYLGDRLIKDLKAGSKIAPGKFMLVNSDGYWLCSPNADDEWGFMFPEKTNRKFSTDFPDAWHQIHGSQTTQIKNKNGLFTSTTVYPIPEPFKSSSGSANAFGNSRKKFEGDSYLWKVISHVPAKTLHEKMRQLQKALLLLVAILLLVLGIISWIIARDMVQRKAYQKALYHSANFDKLTNLPNRALFHDRLNQTLKQSERYQRKFALLFIDLDGFKSVNDTMGHDAGDGLLAQTAQRLLDCVRGADTVARMGGDEFTVILSTITSPDDAKTVAKKIIESISKPFEIEHHKTKIGASIGISIFPEHGRDINTLLKNADDAMYATKKAGKNDFKVSSI
ncbi:MAG: sensor domain-containing diguanylate cyclase [Deltaproteobacteria bacterium]|nr:sensor domain-containing diguanylate cyclase [Deltaproteobacteria bacterium]